MIAPEPPPHLPPSPAGPAAWLRWSAAIALGAGLAAALLAMAVRQRHDLVFGAHGGLGAVGAMLAAALAATAGRCAWAAGERRLAGVGLGALLALAGVAGACGAPGRAAAEIALAAAGGMALGASSGLVAGRAVLGAAAAAIAAALGLRGQPAAVHEVAGLAGLAVLGAIVFVPAPAPVDGASPGRWQRLAHALAAALAVAGAVRAFAFVAMPGALGDAVVVAAVVALLAAVAGRTNVAAFAGTAALFGVAGLAPTLASGEVPVAGQGDAAVGYVRATQELRLRVGDAVLEAVGPDRVEAPLAATLARAFTRAGDRVLVFGASCSRAVAHLAAGEDRVVDVVDGAPAAASLQPWLLQDGPVRADGQQARPARVRTRAGSAARALAALATGARQAIVWTAPLDLEAPALRDDCQRDLARVCGSGVVLHAFALDRVPAAALQQLLATAHAAHAWNGLFVVGDAAVLASAAAAPDLAPLRSFAAWPAAARWCAHEAHLGDAADIGRALRGTVRAPAVPLALAPGASGRSAALEVLGAWLMPAAAGDDVAAATASLLQRWTALQAEMRAAVAQLQRLPDDAAGREQAQALAARFLHVGAPRAELQAALGLAGPDGVTLRAPVKASLAALQIDPTFFAAPAAVYASLPLPTASVSSLEDIDRVVVGPRLAERASGASPAAIALRARFPSRCAQALVQQLAAAALAPPASEALRELADVFVLREAAAAVAGRGGERELLALWRGDLPMPEALGALVRSSGDDRKLLAAALRSRRDPSCRLVLADLLEAPEREVRQLAAEALRTSLGDRVPYDADGAQSDRHAAAERVRSLHNRAP